MSLKSLIAKVKDIPQMVQESCDIIASNAQGKAPRGVSVSSNGSVITARGPMAAWVEFGTGQFAEDYTSQLPDNWDKYAMGYFITGEGKRPQTPYLFNSFEEERVLLLEKIKNKITNG